MLTAALHSLDQEGHGLEAEIDWRPTGAVRLRANYAWQRSEDSETGDRIANVPDQQFHVSLDWRVSPYWTFNTLANWVAGWERADGDTRENVDDYTLVDMTLRHRLTTRWGVSASVHNVFDEDASEPSLPTIPKDVPLEGRSLFVSSSVNF